MNYKEHITGALEHIETNLKDELNLSDLARVSGYSEYHFIRIFKQATGLTPVDYIRKRRLSEIAREMENNDRPMSDIAFEYGFNSKENFTRAFKTEHRILPTEYKESGNSLMLYDRCFLEDTHFDVIPDIVAIPGFLLTGYESDEEIPSQFWNKYNCKRLSIRLSGGKIVADYGVHICNNDNKSINYFIGIKSDDAKGDIAGTTQLDIPGGLYAVFTTPPATSFNFSSTIYRTWMSIFSDWMPTSGYRCAGWSPYQLDVYTESSRTYIEDIYVPIEKIE